MLANGYLKIQKPSLMDPFRSMNKVYSLVIQKERNNNSSIHVHVVAPFSINLNITQLQN